MKTQLVLFISLMVMHLIADYFLQSREMGQQKSSSWKMLFKHGWIQFLVFFFGVHAILCYYAFTELPFGRASTLFFMFGIISFILAVKNAFIHMLVDKITWNAYKYFKARQIGKQIKQENAFELGKEQLRLLIMERAKTFKYYEDSWFYHTIGIDQFLHIVTIAFVYQKFLFML